MKAKHYHFLMPSLRVEIVRFVDEEPQPGIVESRFRDASGKVHSIIDKVPIFTCASLWTDSDYPQSGFARCRVLERMPASSGEDLVRITIADPDGLETTEDQSEFVISEADLSD